MTARGTAEGSKGATRGAPNPATIFIFAGGLAPLYPALKINLDAAQDQGSTWAIVAMFFVVFGAIFLENAVHAMRARQAGSALLCGLLGLGFLSLNLTNALGNVAGHSDASRDQKRSQQQVSATISEQRSQWSQRRAEQAKVAGEATPEALEAEAKATQAGNAGLWRASEGCDTAKLYSDRAKAFCKSLADLEVRRAAAVKRDQIDTQLAKLDEKAETKGEAPSTVDSFADAMADGLAAFGYSGDKASISRARDWGRAIGVELLAGFGRIGILLLVAFSVKAPARVQPPLPVPARKATPEKKAAPVAAPEPVAQPEEAADDYQAFILRLVEPCQGESRRGG